MGFPLRLTTQLSAYLMGKSLTRQKRFPLVLMLEITFRCNLSCTGCGRIHEYSDIFDQRLSVEEAIEAVEESGAPVVTVTGGEPLVHPQVAEIVEAIIERRRFVHLCTNGLLLERSLPRFKASPYLTFVFHLDGWRETHDRITGRDGVFDSVMHAIRLAKARGFRVHTNTTIYKNTDPAEIERLFATLMQEGVDGLLVAPGFSYEAVGDDLFVDREEFARFFQPIFAMRHRYRFYNTPLYLRFLAGERQLQCTPWGNPSRNPKGWKRPCYLITDGHCSSYRELIEETDWDHYGVGKDPRCANCMMHCGFEPSAVLQAGKHLPDLGEMIRWHLFS